MNADFAALDTDLQCRIISSRSTSLVSSMPKATIAKLSPTSIVSMPAVSATRPLGKSCAVIIVMGSPFLYIDRRVCSVIFFLGVPETGASGPWELCRICHCEAVGMDAMNVGRTDREAMGENAERTARDLIMGAAIVAEPVECCCCMWIH